MAYRKRSRPHYARPARHSRHSISWVGTSKGNTGEDAYRRGAKDAESIYSLYGIKTIRRLSKMIPQNYYERGKIETAKKLLGGMPKGSLKNKQSVFPKGDLLPKGRKYEIKFIMPKEFWEKRVSMAEWKERDAKELVKNLKPYEGHYVALTGGGMIQTDEFWIAKLDKVELDHPTYHGKIMNGKRIDTPAYKPKDKYVVIAHLSEGKLSPQLSSGPLPVKTPNMGSWKIGKIDEKQL